MAPKGPPRLRQHTSSTTKINKVQQSTTSSSTSWYKTSRGSRASRASSYTTVTRLLHDQSPSIASRSLHGTSHGTCHGRTSASPYIASVASAVSGSWRRAFNESMCRCVDVEIVDVSWCCAKLLPKFFDVDVPKFVRKSGYTSKLLRSVGLPTVDFFRSLSPFLKFFLWEPWSDLQPSECRFNSLAGVTNPKLPANVFSYFKAKSRCDQYRPQRDLWLFLSFLAPDAVCILSTLHSALKVSLPSAPYHMYHMYHMYRAASITVVMYCCESAICCNNCCWLLLQLSVAANCCVAAESFGLLGLLE